VNAVEYPPLDVDDSMTRVFFVPTSVELLGDRAELDDKFGRQIWRLDLAAFFLPEPDEGGFVVAHDDSGVGATDEATAVRIEYFVKSFIGNHGILPFIS